VNVVSEVKILFAPPFFKSLENFHAWGERRDEHYPKETKFNPGCRVHTKGKLYPWWKKLMPLKLASEVGRTRGTKLTPGGHVHPKEQAHVVQNWPRIKIRPDLASVNVPYGGLISLINVPFE
jgi:hypothetical protein